jgi:hypothetical protein
MNIASFKVGDVYVESGGKSVLLSWDGAQVVLCATELEEIIKRLFPQRAGATGRAESVIRAYIDEERRAVTTFNEANALALEVFLAELHEALQEG